jgi:hypothetical protein
MAALAPIMNPKAKLVPVAARTTASGEKRLVRVGWSYV